MLTLRNIRKTYRARGHGREPIVAVDDLTLEVRRGEVFGLLGPNGAGKSTSLGIAVGLITPESGEAVIDGAGSPTTASGRRSVGVSPQALAVYEDLSAEENLRFFGRLYGLRGADLASRTEEMLTLSGLHDRRRDRVSGYSGGMKRRLNIASALMHRPALLLLDEPTVGVDPQSRNAIFEQIETLRDRGLTVVYTTHYMEEAQRLCNRIGVIDHGRLLAVDTPDGLIARFGGKSRLVVTLDTGEESSETDDPVRDVSVALARGGVRGVRIDRPNLETVFLKLTGRSLRD